MDNARPLTCAIAQLADDVRGPLKDSTQTLPVALQPWDEASFLAGIVQADVVPHRILGVPGARLAPAGHGLPREAKIARHLSRVLYPLLQRRHNLRQRLW